MAWHCLRLAGIGDTVADRGRLFTLPLGAPDLHVTPQVSRSILFSDEPLPLPQVLVEETAYRPPTLTSVSISGQTPVANTVTGTEEQTEKSEERRQLHLAQPVERGALPLQLDAASDDLSAYPELAAVLAADPVLEALRAQEAECKAAIW